MRWILLVALAAASALVPARAYTPESGVWWSPAWTGTGLQIEIQDNLLTVTVYAYDADGFPMWYTSAGFLDDSATVYQGNLQEFFGGPCVGCAFQPNTFIGDVGTIRIVFDPLDPTRATLTWGLDGGPQRSFPIERYHFYLRRGEDGNVPSQITRMLGEWNMVVDQFDDDLVQYYGDVHVYDLFERDGQDWFFEGCRPETSVDQLCTDAAFDAHPVAGVYRPQDNSYRIVVVDYFDATANRDVCAVYDVIVGTNHFDGGQDGDLEPNDGGAAYYYCPQPANSTVPYDGNYDFYPIEGFRSASRTHVEEGVGPASAVDKAARKPAQRRGPSVSLRGEGKAIGTPSAEDAALLRRLEQRIRDRQQSR